MTAVQEEAGVPGFGMSTTRQFRRPSLYVVYAALIGVFVFGSMSWKWFEGLAFILARPTAGHELSFAFYLAWALALIGCLTLALCTAGPLGLARPALTWCLGSPPISKLLLWRSFRSRILVATAVAGMAGASAASAIWPVCGWLVRLVTIVGASLVGAALVVLTAAEQVDAPAARHRARFATSRAGGAAIVVGVLIWYLASFGVITVGAGTALGLVGAVATVIVALGAGRQRGVRQAIRTGVIRLGELYRAADLLDRLSASAVMLTTVFLEPTPRRRRPIRFTASARLTRGWAGWLALLDVRRVLARWPAMLAAVCLVPLVGSVTRVAGRSSGQVVLTVLAFAVASRLARWFFAWSASPSLKFLVPFRATSTRVGLLAAPVLGVLMFSAAAVELAGLSPWWIATSLVCALVGIERRVVRAKVGGGDFDLLLMTPMGAVPVNMVGRFISGWDVAVLGGLLGIVLPDAAVFPTALCLGLLYAVWAGARMAWAAHHRAPPGNRWSRRAHASRILPRVNS